MGQVGLRMEPVALVYGQYEPRLIDPSFSNVELAFVIVAILDWVGVLDHSYILGLIHFRRIYPTCLSRYSLLLGLNIAPCGLPLKVTLYRHSSKYPEVSKFSINLRKRLSLIFSFRVSRRIEWSSESKHCAMSPSVKPFCPYPLTVDFA